MSGRGRRWLVGPVLRALAPALVLVAIWWPELTHYDIDRSDVPTSELSALATVPPDTVLDEVAQIDLAELDRLAPNAAELAAQVAQRRLDIPGLTAGPVALQGFPADLQLGPPTFSLFIASLTPEQLLLRGFAERGDAGWLQLALERTLQLARIERTTRHDNGFLWNDHAVASRVSVLVGLWSLIRHRPDMLAANGGELLSFAQRSGRLLAKPELFTVRTNHGVMQNIGLLQLAAAFPALPEAAAWRALALQRLQRQLGFYVSPEGAVLEHSSAYQAMGSKLLGDVQRLRRLNGLAADPALDALAARSRTVLATLRRPDGSLPLLGNTSAGYALPEPADSQRGMALYPAAGWTVWWQDGATPRETQLALTWAKHDGHGHKHADEGSLHLWSGGVDWLTAAGYWPYGAPLLAEAYGWRGSNAPHGVGESADTRRRAELLASADAGATRFIDVLRRNDAGPNFRRQLLQVAPDAWLVVDAVSQAAQGAQTLWTFDPRLRVQLTSSGGASTLPLADGRRLQIAIDSSDAGLRAEPMRASRAPFAGWVVVRGIPTPADTLEVTQPSPNAVTATLFELGLTAAPVAVKLADGATAEAWQAELSVGGREIAVQRDKTSLTLSNLGGAAPPLRLALAGPPPGLAAELAALRGAYADAVKAYPPWRDLFRYRVRASQVIVVLWLALELALAGLSLRRRGSGAAKAATPWPALALAAPWLAFGLYLNLVYLRV